MAEPYFPPAAPGILAVDWRFAGATLAIRANLTKESKPWPAVIGETIFALSGGLTGPSITVAIDREQR